VKVASAQTDRAAQCVPGGGEKGALERRLTGYNTESLAVNRSRKHVWRLPCPLHLETSLEISEKRRSFVAAKKS